MKDSNDDGRHVSDFPAPEWNTRPERRRTYPDDEPAEWEDEHVDLGGEG
ncbi:MAG TPA: hypothetical protein VFW33_18685 [Gemmataceae bacterium]|nr:hypothetical protein [Gemmataceae bacterium]